MTFQVYTFVDALVTDGVFGHQSFQGDFSGGYVRANQSQTNQSYLAENNEAITTAVRQMLFKIKLSQPVAGAGRFAFIQSGNFQLGFYEVGAAGFVVGLNELANPPLAIGSTIYPWDTDVYGIWYEDTVAGYDRVAMGTSAGTLAGCINVDRSVLAAAGDVLGTSFIWSSIQGLGTAFTRYALIVMANGANLTELGDPTAMSSGLKGPTSGTPQFDDFTFLTGGTNKWEVVDEWATGSADDDTTTNSEAGNAGVTYKQTYKTTALTASNIRAVRQVARIRDNVSGKSNTGKNLQADGTNSHLSAAVTLSGTSYKMLGTVWNLAPDSTSWDQTDLNNLQIGVQTVIGSQADADYLTAVHADVLSVPLLSAEPSQWGVTRRRPMAGPVLTAGGVGVV